MVRVCKAGLDVAVAVAVLMRPVGREETWASKRFIVARNGSEVVLNYIMCDNCQFATDECKVMQ